MKTHSPLFFLLLLCCGLLLSSCGWDYERASDDYNYLLKIQNNSAFDIISYEASGTEAQPTMYPDTLLPAYFYEDMDVLECLEASEGDVVIQSGTSFPIFRYRKEDISKKEFDKHFKSGIYSVFIIDAQTAIHEKSWEQIQEDYDILVRYDLTFDDIHRLGKVIPFPPTDEMKGMKMFPPYDDVVERCRSFAEMSR